MHMERLWSVSTTPQRPVGVEGSRRYSTWRPALVLASRRISAYLSEPTQPMKRTEEGGRMYCFCREIKDMLVSGMDQIFRSSGFG